MPLFKRLLRCVLILVFTLFGGTQQPAAQSPVAPSSPATRSNSTNANTELLTLDLIALDKDDHAVTDLKSEELRIFENKVELKIETLSPAARVPLTIGLFFDVSGSRRADSHVEEETRLVGELLRSIWREGDTAFLVAFNDRPLAVVQPTQKLEDIHYGLKQIPGDHRGSTSLYDALCSLEAEKLTAVPGRKAYAVFSDFEDNSSRNKIENVIEVGRQAKVSIFPVILSEGFGGGVSKRVEKRSRQQAQRVAEETGGDFFVPESVKQLPAALQRLGGELQGAYRITYVLPSAYPRPKWKSGRIKIETTREHVKLIYPKS